MSDFHASLDRALDPHNHWGIEGDALTDLMAARELVAAAPRPAPEMWPALGWIDEAMELRNQDLIDLQDRINAAIISRDGAYITFGLLSPGMQPRHYDFTPRDTAIVDSFMIRRETDGWGGWNDVPIAEQQIPAEGTE